MLWVWMWLAVRPALVAAVCGAAVAGGVMGIEYLKAWGGTTEQAVVTRVTRHDDELFTGCKGAPKYTLNLRSEHPPAGLSATFTSSGCDLNSYAVGDVVPVRRVHGRVVLDPPDFATIGFGLVIGALAGPVFRRGRVWRCGIDTAVRRHAGRADSQPTGRSITRVTHAASRRSRREERRA